MCQNIGKHCKVISEKLVKIKKDFGKDERKEDFNKLAKLKESLCEVCFKRYLERDAKPGSLILPPIHGGINKVVDTMERWCMKANTSPSNVKGLVVHNFSLSGFFQFFLYDKSDATSLCEELEKKYCKYFRLVSEPIVIVFNPKDSVILLIRKSGEKMFSEKME